jgi:hypothetical protein
MSTPLEDRLRAHYQERTAREPLPGPDGDEAMERTLAEAARRGSRRRSNGHGFDRTHLLMAAAAVLVVAAVGAVAFVVTRRDEGPNVSTRGPERTTTTEDTRPDPSSTSSSTTSTTASSTTSTTAAPPAATDLSMVVGVDGVMGWWDGSGWVQAEQTSELPITDEREYDILRVGDAPRTATGQPGEVECLEGGGTAVVDVGLTAPTSDDEPVPIAVTGVADPQPRPVTVVDPGNASYRDSAVQVLADLGIEDPDPPIVQAVRVDFDGDGTDEVLVTAERIAQPDSPYFTVGNYSVTFLRQVVGGAVDNRVVVESTVQVETVDRLTISRVATGADLNGDGRMELVLGYRYYEGSGTEVYEVGSDGTATRILTGGCGV